jgi:tetratricopeptide (TPR) repeat protein
MLSNLKNNILYVLSMIVICIHPINYTLAEDAQQLEQIEYLTSSHAFEKALEMLDEAIKFEPNNAKLYKKKAYCLLLSRSYKEAVENYDKAIELGDTSTSNLTNKAAALIPLKRYQEVFELTTIALSKKDGKTAENYHHLCGALTGLDKFKDAIVACNTAVSLEPSYAQIRATRSSTLWGLKRYEEALADIDTAINLNPSLPDLYYNKGLILQGLHREQEALGMFQKAARLKKYL